MRVCHPVMVAFFDEAFKTNELAQHYIATKNARGLFLECARAAVGKIMEVGGNNRGPLVGAVQSVLGANVYKQKGDGASWCMSDVQTFLAYAELKTGKKSKVYADELCSSVWAHSPAEIRVKRVPAPGAIAIFGHFKKDKSGLYMIDTGQGHTGVTEQYLGATMINLEGNTTSGSIDGTSKIVRDGGGDYRCVRSAAILNRHVEMQLKGWLIPFDNAEVAA